MKRSFWLASYPKSGNTWFRILLANLADPGDTPININMIDSTEGIASARWRFDDHLLIESGLLANDTIDQLRPAFHAYLAERTSDDVPDKMPVRFVKTHDAYTLNTRGEPVMGGRRGGAGVLLIVRDPRDVVSSFAHHFGQSLDQAIGTMNNPRYRLAGDRSGQPPQLRQRLLDWSGFVASWLDQRDIPVHLIRYEDLHQAPQVTLATALDFVGWDPGPAAIDRAIGAAAMDELQRQEARHGFGEGGIRAQCFFRRGLAGGWRGDLNATQIARIEQNHWPMMKRLGCSASNANYIAIPQEKIDQ